ncbi:MAG: sigma-70 family RNA polymerase sigma factor [Alphaproteobacteria bacterium]|nr:MAG: sigma-70 family RNA polymerase sigma factor [Alphaproteobacteria bacterium]
MVASDESLAAAAARGDRAAFASLVERHYDRIFRLGFRILGSRADAEDLAQDICVALPGKLARFDGRSRFATWLHRVVINAARDVLRRRASRARAGDGWGDIERMRRAEAAERRDSLDWLAAAMTALKPDLRETVALVLGEEMSHAEAAAVLGLSEGSVSWRMSEVRKTLRALAAQEERI